MIKIKELKEGDPIFWNEGKSYYNGTFKKLGEPLLDLERIIYVDKNETEDSTLAIFLIDEETYKTATDSAKVKKVKLSSDGTPIVKEKKVKDSAPAANIKGLSSLLEKEGLTITKGDKWFRYNVSGRIVDYRGPIRDIFEAVKANGSEGMFSLHQDGTVKTKTAKVAKEYEPKPNIKGLQFLLNKEGIQFEKTGEKWFRYSFVRDGEKGTFDYRGPLNIVFNTLVKKGVEKMFALNQFEG